MSHPYLVHKHHIIPKHLGGSDHPSNLVTLSVQEHAKAHWVLFHLYGHEADRLAWLGLSGLIGKEEIIKESFRLGGKKKMVSCIKCKKSFGMTHWIQHERAKSRPNHRSACWDTPLVKKNSAIISCVSCRKTFNSGNFTRHKKCPPRSQLRKGL